jgi:hypothetical protein
MKWINKARTEFDAELLIIDIDKQSFLEALRRKGLPVLPWLFPAYRVVCAFRGLFTRLFTSEISVSLFVKVISKNARLRAKPGTKAF